MRHILMCNFCKKYTMKDFCCGKKTVEIKPPKYSPEDKYAIYRRQYKKENIEKNEKK